MRKHIFIFLGLAISCALFSTPALGKTLSKRRLRQLVEELAVPLHEKRIFYRWQSEESHDTLLKEGEFSKERLDYFMKKKDGIYAGPGLYIAEDLHSSQHFGTHIIQVEIDRGTKYIDLTDPKTLEKIWDEAHWVGELIPDIINDIEERSSNIAIKYNSQHWVLKTNEGINFQPFSAKGLPLNSLDGQGMRKPQFQEIAKGEILEHVKKDPLSVIRASAVKNFLKDIFGKKYVADNLVSRLPIDSMSIGDIIELFPYAPYLSTDMKDKLFKKAQSLPIFSVKQAGALIQALFSDGKLNAKLRTEIVQKTPIHTMDAAVSFLKQVPFFNLEDREKIISNIGRHYTNTSLYGLIPPYNTEDLDYLKRHISPEAMRRLLKKTIPFAKTDIQKLRILELREYLEPEDYAQVLNDLVRLIDEVADGNRILLLADALDPLDRKAIAKQVLRVTPRMKRRKALKSLKAFFTQIELDQFLVELKEEKAAQRSSKGKLHKVTNRLNCLKKQLSSVLSRH